MTLPLERSSSRRPITWLSVMGLMLLPAVIGGILVTALETPDDRLDEMTAAVVNLDEPITIDGQFTPLGRVLAAGLVEGSDTAESNFTWVISNEDDAASGLANGEYQVVVTIPESFSATATSASRAVGDPAITPEKAEITVVTPSDARVTDDLITSYVASVATSTMSHSLSQATLDNVLLSFTTIGEQIGTAADGADELASGAEAATAGAREIPTGAAGLADGAEQLRSGSSSLASGLRQLSAGSREATTGATTLGTQLHAGADAVRAAGIIPTELTQAAQGSAAGSAAVADGVNQLVAGAQQLYNATCIGRELDPTCGGLAMLLNSTPDLQQGAELVVRLAQGTSAGISQVAEQAPQVIASQLAEAGNGAFALRDGLGALTNGLDQSTLGAEGLTAGASGIRDGAHLLAEGGDQLVTGLEQLTSGTGELASGLHAASESLPSLSEERSSTIAEIATNPVGSDSSGNTIFGATAIPLLATVVLWFGGLATFVVLRPFTSSVLTSRTSSAGIAWRALAPAAAIGAAQGVLVSIVVQFFADYSASQFVVFLVVATLTGVSFAAVNQALIAIFGGIGRWISALVGVTATATGVISTIPGWIADIGGALPTAPAVSGLISFTGGSVTALVLWALLGLMATIAAVVARRTTSSRRVLEAA